MLSLKDAIVDEALTWVGVPYKHAGRNRMGVDCAGLLVKVAHELGVSNYDNTNYSPRPNQNEFLKALRGNLDRIGCKDLGHGDIAVFRAPIAPVHCGIVEVDKFGQSWIIHSSLSRRKVVREPLVGQQLGRLIMAFQYREPA